MAKYILTHYDIATFIAIKMFSTIIVVGIIMMLYSFRRTCAKFVTIGLATFQAYLFLYLLFADNRPPN